ncbi:MAG: hypothetical protein LBH64_03840 [Coriobacteriales bacterium]|jgi:phage protein D|nr:hypothetical protein [Coriobacteriales bacterium]
MSSFASLAKTYSGFSVPTYQVSVEGTEIQPTMARMASIRVDLSMGAVASACRFVLYGIYDRESRSVSSKLLKLLKPGARLAVSLGYVSTVTEVFTGYIAAVTLHYDLDEQGVRLEVTGLDARALMKGSYARSLEKGKTTKTLIEAALKNYSPVVSSVDVKLDELTDKIHLAQDGDDLDFVCEAARLRGLYFYIDCGLAYLGKAKDTVSIAFDWEQCGANLTLNYLNTEHIVQGYNYDEMTPFTARASAKGLVVQSNSVQTKSVLPLAAYYAGDGARAIVAAAAASDVRASVGGMMNCAGIPEPKLGHKLKLNKSPLASAGMGESFVITTIHHDMDDENGYQTTIGFEGPG